MLCIYICSVVYARARAHVVHRTCSVVDYVVHIYMFCCICARAHVAHRTCSVVDYIVHIYMFCCICASARVCCMFE